MSHSNAETPRAKPTGPFSRVPAPQIAKLSALIIVKTSTKASGSRAPALGIGAVTTRVSKVSRVDVIF